MGESGESGESGILGGGKAHKEKGESGEAGESGESGLLGRVRSHHPDSCSQSFLQLSSTLALEIGGWGYMQLYAAICTYMHLYAKTVSLYAKTVSL